MNPTHIPTTSTTTTTTTTVLAPSNPYLQTTPAPTPPSQVLYNLTRKFESAAKRAESFYTNLYTHFRTGSNPLDVAFTRLDQAARLMIDGGSDNVYRKDFGHVPGEKLKKAYACYLSTTTGPIMGTLYISNMRIGFRSESPVWNGVQWVFYRVVVSVEDVLAVNPSVNRERPMEKYIEVATKDGHEFWFMGFISYDTALKNLRKVLKNYN